VANDQIMAISYTVKDGGSSLAVETRRKPLKEPGALQLDDSVTSLAHRVQECILRGDRVGRRRPSGDAARCRAFHEGKRRG
jgi:hypothetical protein